MQANLGTNFISRANKRLILLMQKHATTDAFSAHIVPPEQKEDIAALQRVLTALKGAAETPVAAQQGPRSGGHVAVTSILPFAEHAAHAKGMLAMLKAAPAPLNAPQQAAPQQVPAAESTAATTREQQALEYLAMLKKTQDEFCGCAFTVPIMPPGDEPGQPVTINNFYFTMPISSTPVAAAAGDAEANTQAEHAAVLPQSVPILQADAIAAMICNMHARPWRCLLCDFPA